MHFHAEHSLFFERRQPLWAAVLAVALTIGVLVVNTGMRSTTFSLVGASVAAMMLLVVHARGHSRIAPGLAWIVALVVLALFGGIVLDISSEAIFETTTRILCGVLWGLWLGTQLDWASLRQLLLLFRVPEGAVASLDHAVMHGALTKREWVQRRDAARLRLGSAQLPLAAWGPLLGEGVVQAFTRLESAEENALLRSAKCEAIEASEAVHLDAVDVDRGGQSVLEQLELRLGRREWLLVGGPSGAGKSSLLRLMAGLEGPTQGAMIRFGHRVLPESTLRERLDGRAALLNQNPEHHFIASTVAEDVAWGMLRRGVESSEAHRRCLEVAKSLRIEHLLQRPCHQLSFGEQRRVALAGLLVLEPKLLLLDEPTAGLDPVAAYELRTLVETSVGTTGAACVWATHDLAARPPKATRVVLLQDRRIVFDGAAAEGLSEPWLIRAGLAVPPNRETAC